MRDIIELLAGELDRRRDQIENVVTLLDEGNTIPFIARYRKELHGAMDDGALRKLEERLAYLRSLEERCAVIKKAIEAQGKLTDELAAAIDGAATLAEAEDLYRPYKPKRRTRASIAREKGLEPLAETLYAQNRKGPAPEEAAQAYLSPENGVETVEDALAGASDIIAETISDDAALRKTLRALLRRTALAVSKAAGEEDSVYRLYYDFSRPVSRLQGHQVLAMDRGEKEGFLSVKLDPDRDRCLQTLCRQVVVPGTPAMAFVKAAAEDAWDRLLWPSLERELRSDLTAVACEGAIGQFAQNLRPVLMQPPVKGKVTLGLDPGYRNGCKTAVVDGTGKVLATAVVYPTFGEKKREEAIETLSRLVHTYGVAHIAIGNGTASRETEQMAVELIRREGEQGRTLRYMIVSEAGASVYSASPLAAEEMPDLDVNLRSAVSIARRLQDPLAELVKIDPKAIGVGQYQHDMPQKRLEEALDGVVEDCVNAVGVDVNTASPALLRRVSGLTAATAKNVVAYREEHGAYTARKELLKVPKLGPKAFQQCAGFQAAGPHRPHPGRRGRGEGDGPPRPDEGPGGGEAGGGLRRGGAHPGRRGPGAHEARPGYPGGPAPAGAPDRRAGDQGLKAGDGADGHGAERHRLRGLCGHRGPPGRPGPHLPDRGPVREAPLGGGLPRGRGPGGGPGGGREEEADQPVHAPGGEGRSPWKLRP